MFVHVYSSLNGWDGKAYSIVTDHLGTPVEAYNEQGEEVWYRRLDMNGKVIEESSMYHTSNKDCIKIPLVINLNM